MEKKYLTSLLTLILTIVAIYYSINYSIFLVIIAIPLTIITIALLFFGLIPDYLAELKEKEESSKSKKEKRQTQKKTTKLKEKGESSKSKKEKIQTKRKMEAFKTENLVDEVKAQAKELFKDEYCRGQLVYVKISYAKLDDYEDSDIPSDILEFKKFTDNAGNINDDKLDSLKKFCVVGFDIHRDDYSELLDVSKFSIGLASSFYLTNAHFNSEENMPTISCEAVFFMPIAEGIDKINFDMSNNPIEYFEEGFELFIPIDGEYGVPPAERCSYSYGEVLELNIDKKLNDKMINTHISSKQENEQNQSLILPNGNKYEGELKNGKMHGQGVLTVINGGEKAVEYVGEFKNDYKHGQGTMTYSSGQKIVGEWKNDVQDGQGIWTLKNGTVVHKGLWIDGDPID